MRSNFFSFEDNAVEEDPSEGGVDQSEIIEAQTEATEVSDEVDQTVTDIQTGEEELETVSDVQEVIDDSIESGEGLSEVTVESIRVTLRRVMRRLNGPVEYVDQRYSPEAFVHGPGRLKATKLLALENQGIGARIIEGIKNAFARLIDLLASFASKFMSFQMVLIRALDGLERRIKVLGSSAKVKDDWAYIFSAKQVSRVSGEAKDPSFKQTKSVLDKIPGNITEVGKVLKDAGAEAKRFAEFIGNDVKMTDVTITPLVREGQYVQGIKTLHFLTETSLPYWYGPVVKVDKKDAGSTEFSGAVYSVPALGDKSEKDAVVTSKDVPSVSELSAFVAGLKKLVGSNKDNLKNLGELKDTLKSLIKVINRAGIGEAKGDELSGLKQQHRDAVSLLRDLSTTATTVATEATKQTTTSIRTGMWYVNVWLGAYSAGQADSKDVPISGLLK